MTAQTREPRSFLAISPDLHRELKVRASQTGETIRQLVTRLCRAALASEYAND